MPALDFPDAPALGDKYPVPHVAGVPDYMWDGEKWTSVEHAHELDLTGFLPLAGGIMTGDIVLKGDPSAVLHPATKQYADKMLPLIGGTLSGPLTGTTLTLSGLLTVNANVITTGGLTASNPITGGSTVAAKQVGSGNANFPMLDNTGAQVAAVYWNAAAKTVNFQTFGAQGINSANLWFESSGRVNVSGSFAARAGGISCWVGSGGSANFQCLSADGATQNAAYYWSSNVVTLQNFTGVGGYLNIDANGNLNVSNSITAPGAINAGGNINAGTMTTSGQIRAGTALVSGTAVQAGTGYYGKAGSSGAYGGNLWNYYWGGAAMQVWVDASNIGNMTVASDYRIKRNVAPLPSMWERAKRLRPISYQHQDYTPVNATPKDDGSVTPLVVGDDIERWGFIAHELQGTLTQDAATGVKDDPVCLQSPNPWTVIATLTKALQEAMGRIEVLEAAAR